ncbi:DNA-binding protein [Mycolicibacterium sp. P9-64]|uniref:helix-turn-helix transcriptional regulator n=1 Tax=Mycolicibacterium sp. P9-64 TaxID=2024612 RepID=UPI0011EC8E53|nr:helix-turn-helix domain-containing protein [Mycolicibacterium sp. P9-64]KAA0083266.1 DNA-binding protein [Mycolicibacterium sp. P9-64]
MTQTDDLLTTREVAAELGVTVSAVYQARLSGRGPISYRRGKRLVFPRSELENYLSMQRLATIKGEGV